MDLTPVLRGDEDRRGRPVISTHGRGNHSIRSGRYRYIRFRNGQDELYDLKEDPWEWRNLADDPQFAELRKRLRTHLPESAPAVEYFEYGSHEPTEQYTNHEHVIEMLGPPGK